MRRRPVRDEQQAEAPLPAAPGAGKSMLGARTFRGATLDELLPQIREELGPDAIILAEREGVVGGFGGFFAKRRVEVDAVARSVVPHTAGGQPSVPARVATSAYTSAPTDSGPVAAEEPLPELSFADLLAQAAPVAAAATASPAVPGEFVPLVTPPEPFSTRIDIIDGEPRPAPAVDDETAVRDGLGRAGFAEPDADELVRHALIHARPFAPHAPLRDVVRAALAASLQTPLGWKARRRVVVLAGTEGAGTAEIAAALCAGYARVGLSVAALGLDGVRATVSLAANTEDAAVAIGIAEEAEDVRRALPRLGKPDLLVAIAPTVVPGDAARQARTAELLAELPGHELHLVLPAGADAADADAAWLALTAAAKVRGLLPVALDEAHTIGGVVSLALRERLEIRWTTSAAGVASAVPHELAARALP